LMLLVTGNHLSEVKKTSDSLTCELQ